MMPTGQVIYDIVRDGLSRRNQTIVIFTSAAIALAFFLQICLQRPFQASLLLVYLCLASVPLAIVYGHNRLLTNYLSGFCAVTEGPIEGLYETTVHNTDRTADRLNRFRVAGRRFQIYPARGPGFGALSGDEGPLWEGLKVSIHHLGDDIARLEVFPESSPGPRSLERLTIGEAIRRELDDGKPGSKG